MWPRIASANTAAHLKAALLLSTSFGSKAGFTWLPFQPPRPCSSSLSISALKGSAGNTCARVLANHDTKPSSVFTYLLDKAPQLFKQAAARHASLLRAGQPCKGAALLDSPCLHALHCGRWLWLQEGAQGHLVLLVIVIAVVLFLLCKASLLDGPPSTFVWSSGIGVQQIIADLQTHEGTP